jgi:hypothetical protein
MISLLAQGYGLLLHAAGIDDDGRGYLFTASSGGGKTTMVRLWEKQARVLNDERIILRQQNGAFWIYGTPWHGEYENYLPHGVPLERIFFIRHAAQNTLQPVAGITAISQLLSHAVLPYWCEKGMHFINEFSAEVVAAVPCYSLGYVPDEQVIPMIRCAR